MEFNINEITYNDVMVATEHNSTLGELKSIGNFDEMLNKFMDFNSSDLYKFRCKILTLYKLGEMQGKRQERARKKKVGVING